MPADKMTLVDDTYLVEQEQEVDLETEQSEQFEEAESCFSEDVMVYVLDNSPHDAGLANPNDVVIQVCEVDEKKEEEDHEKSKSCKIVARIDNFDDYTYQNLTFQDHIAPHFFEGAASSEGSGPSLLGYKFSGYRVSPPVAAECRELQEGYLKYLPKGGKRPLVIYLGSIGRDGNSSYSSSSEKNDTSIVELFLQNRSRTLAWPADTTLKLIYGTGFGFGDFPLASIEPNQIVRVVMDFPGQVSDGDQQKKATVDITKSRSSFSFWTLASGRSAFGPILCVKG